MLPLSGTDFPDSSPTLAAALARGLENHGVTVRTVQAEGGAFPAIETLRLDLTGANITRDLKLSHESAPASAEIRVANLSLIAAPLLLENTPVQFDLHATHATLALSRNSDGQILLTPTSVADGTLTVATARIDLERLAHSLISEAAGKQGIQIKETRLGFTQITARAVGFKAEISAKMFVMSAKIAVTGKLEIDDKLEARISNLGCTGEGMIASAANALLKPHFQRLEGRTFPLLAIRLGEISLRDFAIIAGETLQIRAHFGTA